jgi:hypothetical protein
MTRRLAVLVAALALAVPGHAELGFKALSVTATSQTYMLPVASADVSLCSVGVNVAYFRAFWEGETPAAATTAYIPLPAGTAAAPICFSIPKSATAPNYTKYITIVCDTAETATVHVFYQ